VGYFFASSGALILYNKWLWVTWGFKYPVLTTSVHLFASGIVGVCGQVCETCAHKHLRVCVWVYCMQIQRHLFMCLSLSIQYTHTHTCRSLCTQCAPIHAYLHCVCTGAHTNTHTRIQYTHAHTSHSFAFTCSRRSPRA